jgi:CRP-like cAMP-binding protein
MDRCKKNFMSSENGHTNELYAVLPLVARRELEKHEQCMMVPPGTQLIKHGVLPDRLVILNSGTVQVSVPCPRRPATLTTGEVGKVFGMRAAISGELPEIDVTCMGPCQVTFLPRDSFLDILKAEPQSYFAVAKVLSADLRIADRILRGSLRCRSGPRAKAQNLV